MAQSIADEKARLCFICDIRTADPKVMEMEDTEKYVSRDQEAQMVSLIAAFWHGYFCAGYPADRENRQIIGRYSLATPCPLLQNLRCFGNLVIYYLI